MMINITIFQRKRNFVLCHFWSCCEKIHGQA